MACLASFLAWACLFFQGKHRSNLGLVRACHFKISWQAWKATHAVFKALLGLSIWRLVPSVIIMGVVLKIDNVHYDYYVLCLPYHNHSIFLKANIKSNPSLENLLLWWRKWEPYRYDSICWPFKRSFNLSAEEYRVLNATTAKCSIWNSKHAKHCVFEASLHLFKTQRHCWKEDYSSIYRPWKTQGKRHILRLILH